MTAGWGETEVLTDVSSRRLALVLHRHLAEDGLLSFLCLLRAFRLHGIKRDQQDKERRSQLLPSGGITRNMAQAYLWHFEATQEGLLAETTERPRRIFDHNGIEVWAHPAETPTVPGDLKCRPGDGH
jgi:hypothetical protein